MNDQGPGCFWHEFTIEGCGWCKAQPIVNAHHLYMSNYMLKMIPKKEFNGRNIPMPFEIKDSKMDDQPGTISQIQEIVKNSRRWHNWKSNQVAVFLCIIFAIVVLPILIVGMLQLYASRLP